MNIKLRPGDVVLSSKGTLALVLSDCDVENDACYAAINIYEDGRILRALSHDLADWQHDSESWKKL